jgi:hypothetical protein
MKSILTNFTSSLKKKKHSHTQSQSKLLSYHQADSRINSSQTMSKASRTVNNGPNEPNGFSLASALALPMPSQSGGMPLVTRRPLSRAELLSIIEDALAIIDDPNFE